jgi:hypothetical protein
MQNLEEKSKPVPDKPGFFGMPRGMRIWAEAGPRFWAGVALGIGLGLAFGLVIGGGLVRQGLKSDTSLAGIGLVLMVVGMIFAQWMIGRTSGQK